MNAPLPSNDSALTWHDGLLLGYAPMDHVHEDFVQCVVALREASDAALPAALAALRARFQALRDAGLWVTRRNSIAAAWGEAR